MEHRAYAFSRRKDKVWRYIFVEGKENRMGFLDKKIHKAPGCILFVYLMKRRINLSLKSNNCFKIKTRQKLKVYKSY